METRASKRRKQNLQKNNGSDKTRPRSLDDFPEQLLTHILSFLPTLDAVRTSLLSREWRRRRLWRLLPFLNFIVPFNPVDACTRFLEFIDQTIKNRSDFPIQKFCFRFDWIFYVDRRHDICDRIESKLDEWISYAICHKATKLDIMLPHTHRRYVFNFGLLNCSCVQDVRFSGGILRQGLSLLNLDSIRLLCLTCIRLTDDTFVDLISWCNNLESLALVSCSGMERLRICSSTLKKLSLKDGYGSTLEIYCPNLEYIRFLSFRMIKYCIMDSSSLVEADVDFVVLYDKLSDVLNWWSEVLRVLTTVKRLTTINYWFEILCKNNASLDGYLFENLNHLELMSGYGHCDLRGMAAMLKVCPNITTLTLRVFSFYNIEYNEFVPRKLVDKPIEFSIPNLKILNLEYSKDTEIEEIVWLMKKHGDALEKIVLRERKGKRSSILLGGSS